ncbi:hypothetical protein L873DRAFT_1787395 [Choiromyces venosus 120613-1]|uniref:Uncharacterized protein n=1 Tax=Choiromyces venosus 120613-1 TaxID=1336337 RepID=A0A3N4JX81_9PEZI|nr:hypothetical protein L873DRAFT_1787395 [Choiromyces venosus 120613-1]
MDSTSGGGSNHSFPCSIGLPPGLNLVLPSTLTTAIPPHLRDASRYTSIQKEAERMRIMRSVRISTPKEAKAERKEARSPFLVPRISARTTSHSEFGNGAWTRWVEENPEEESVASLTSSPPRQNLRSEKPRGEVSTVPQNGRGCPTLMALNG